MLKGATIAIICLALGGFLGHRATIFHFETISNSFFEGQKSIKK
jgi:hypothetical protein